MKKAHEYTRKINRKFIRNSVRVECICTAFETNYNTDFYFSGEFHPFWEFVYVLSDCIGVSGDSRIYRLNEGDIIFHKPMEFHRLWAVDDIKPRLFIMSFYIEGSLLKKLENGVFSLNDNQKHKIIELLDYLKKYTIIENDNKQVTHFLNNWDHGCISQNVANRLEAFLLSFGEDDGLNIKKEYSHEEIRTYKQIITILTENIDTWITLDELANRCNISKSQLKRVFAETSPTGIHRYFVRLKIAEAMKLLLSGLSVVETAEALGFSSPNYFSTVFKRETGTTPLNYKRNH
ncbi:MAG: helix-turn-helix transcriptional regulator [Clostridia bacterium]|nr:helix-turn-helix transcriptional regulator [Clostridia bacterium]